MPWTAVEKAGNLLAAKGQPTDHVAELAVKASAAWALAAASLATVARCIDEAAVEDDEKVQWCEPCKAGGVEHSPDAGFTDVGGRLPSAKFMCSAVYDVIRRRLKDRDPWPAEVKYFNEHGHWKIHHDPKQERIG